ncbi:hypothetical protein PTT03_10585 [Serratia ureilytica]|uniref:hypothetical protein n=1 Tax=Serratia ureilytica TaxID=300181 RepID=UPI00313A79F2
MIKPLKTKKLHSVIEKVIALQFKGCMGLQSNALQQKPLMDVTNDKLQMQLKG